MLIGAAFVIHQCQAINDAVILDSQDEGLQPDMSLVANFVGGHKMQTVWNFFPRNLTARQYDNPYRAIRKFCNFMTEAEWKRFTRSLIHHALCNETIDDEYAIGDLLIMRLRVLQLIEACSLVKVRMSLVAAQ